MLSQANMSGEHGNAPAAMKKVPAYLTPFESEASCMIYPIAATVKPRRISGPRILILSLMYEVAMTTRKAKKFGGTVKSCAVTSE